MNATAYFKDFSSTTDVSGELFYFKELLLIRETFVRAYKRLFYPSNDGLAWTVSPLCPHRSKSVVRIYTTVRFEPNKINIFVKDCQRGGKDVTCMSAIVCFNITARTAIPPAQEIGKPVKIIRCSGSIWVLCPSRTIHFSSAQEKECFACFRTYRQKTNPDQRHNVFISIGNGLAGAIWRLRQCMAAWTLLSSEKRSSFILKHYPSSLAKLFSIQMPVKTLMATFLQNGTEGKNNFFTSRERFWSHCFFSAKA